MTARVYAPTNTPMADTSHISRALRLQADATRKFGSPFSGALLDRAGEDVEAGGPTASLLMPWASSTTRELISDAAPVRFLGSLHDWALSGEAPDLTAAYPSADGKGDVDEAWRVARRLIGEKPEHFQDFMGHEPQTNEVRRSACLIGGFLEVARATGLPLRSLEIGASAGLNQYWDRFRYTLGSVGQWGAEDSPVVIDTEWEGRAPAVTATVRVVARAACDRKPVRISDPVARRRLRAYVWADQIDRMTRLDQAIALATSAGISVEEADAVTWTRARAGPMEGTATVLYHSVFWQYVPTEGQVALRAAIEGHGQAASATAPFAWLRMEPPPNDLANMELRLTLWPGGEERLLARVHPHGARVEWLDGA